MAVAATGASGGTGCWLVPSCLGQQAAVRARGSCSKVGRACILQGLAGWTFAFPSRLTKCSSTGRQRTPQFLL